MVNKQAGHDKNNKYITVTQVGSPIGREESQRKTLIGLGLNKLNRSKRLIETPSVLGMVDKVKHLIKIEHS